MSISLTKLVEDGEFKKTGAKPKLPIKIEELNSSLLDVYQVPLKYLYYNDENGRIASEMEKERIDLEPVSDSINPEYNDQIAKLIRKDNSSKLNRTKKDIEKTLIHEIQHAIQNIEHFEGGGSTRTSKLAYYNKLGEIEATDVSNRFETEKYQKKDVSLISPESSKENPKHKNLNDYLKNRGIIDKIKDKAYNTVKEFFNNESRKYDESFEENIGQSDRETTDLVVGRRRYIKKDGRKKLIKDATKELENNSSSFSLPKNEKLSQNKLGRWESFLERNKINKGTTTTLGELRLPEAKRNLPAVKEIQFKDSVNNARYISKEKEVKMILILIKNWNKKVHIIKI